MGFLALPVLSYCLSIFGYDTLGWSVFFFFLNSTILLKTISTFFRKPLTEGVVHWHPGIDVYWSSDRTTMFPLISFHFLWFLTVGIQKNTGTDFFLTFRFHLFPFMRTDQRFPFLSKHNSSTTLSRFVLGEVVLTLIWFLSLYSDPHSNPSHVICRAMRSHAEPKRARLWQPQSRSEAGSAASAFVRPFSLVGLD